MNTLTLVGAELEEVLFGDDYADRSICKWWNSNDSFTTNVLRYAVNNGGIELLNLDTVSPAANNIDEALAILEMAIKNDLFAKDENDWYIYPTLPDFRLMPYSQNHPTVDRTQSMLRIKFHGKEADVEVVGL